ncbi:MAG: efflux transporter periplasmic adaptor subunit [Curvibacter sp. RIFCSPHIGHO2_12_FULL_63_18]|uniref:efflux RND transporter periplasmic adaptor subunit n=1 Tax=Rhodoferax sp. TaxID=50421 RepID=UPI0008D41DC9|nr:efflux RND transporter periplasmic adaptor subunit [Rhodoferax sp.]OGO95235.1 MAG: efflux transporter periplasmic adaptor subunit [Curvibacter sp. GWA2_63_95]OGP03372.1 MAG: efflux transporter periplasmic adaptor subunit [Curvibacter sp. RIFCSPHIGHO2_12_FULL_63_18]HCX81266.1 efflux transporter periplasmic adaptor subunit [Rhodoferax sp.]
MQAIRLHLSNRRLLAIAAAVLALTGGAAAIFGTTSTSAQPAAQAPATPVSVATVVQSEVVAWEEFSGRLEAVERVDIRPRVAGTLQAVHFREGALVKKGELLLTIDPAPYALDVQRAEAQVAAAQAKAAQAKGEQERAQRLWNEQAISRRDMEERGNGQREADANLRAAQAALQTAQLSLDYTQVRAPVSGRVGKLELTVGNLVAAGPGAPVLTTLVSVSPIYASFDADEQVVAKALREVNAGGDRKLDRIPVQMGTSASSDTPFAGKLQLVDNQVDAKSGTVRARAVFDNKDGQLMPGQFARIRMGQATKATALLISERAVGTDQNKKFVMVVGADNKVAYREVTLGASVNGLRVIKSGLEANERIVVNGLQRIRPGALVAPEVVEMTAKADTAGGGKPVQVVQK